MIFSYLSYIYLIKKTSALQNYLLITFCHIKFRKTNFSSISEYFRRAPMAVWSGEIPHYVIARGALRHIKANEQQRSSLGLGLMRTKTDLCIQTPRLLSIQCVVVAQMGFSERRGAELKPVLAMTGVWWVASAQSSRRLSSCERLHRSTTNRLCKYDINSVYLEHHVLNHRLQSQLYLNGMNLVL